MPPLCHTVCATVHGMSFFILLLFAHAFLLGSRPLLRSASDMIHCSCPLVERNSSAAHFSMAAIVSESTRRTKLLVLLSFFIFSVCGFASGGLTAYCHLCPYSVFMFVQRSPVLFNHVSFLLVCSIINISRPSSAMLRTSGNIRRSRRMTSELYIKPGYTSSRR